MSTPVLVPGLFESWPFLKGRLKYGVVALVTLGAASALNSPSLTKRLFASNFLPHSFCYLGSQGLIWTHVLTDFLIFLAYFAISATLVYLVYKGHREIPFHWMFLAFGLFIVACGATHLMEAITVWFPVYVLSGGVKIFTALASLTTAIILPFTVSQILSLVKRRRALPRLPTTVCVWPWNRENPWAGTGMSRVDEIYGLATCRRCSESPPILIPGTWKTSAGGSIRRIAAWCGKRLTTQG
jgi:hypothetical protein